MDHDDILARYRDCIDNIDAALVFMLAERFKVTQAVGEYKADRATATGRSRSAKNGKSNACANWRAMQNLTPILPRSFCASSSTKSSATMSKSATRKLNGGSFTEHA